MPRTRHPKRAPTPQQRAQRIAIAFLGIVIALAVAVSLFSLGRVRVVVTARPVPIRADIRLTFAENGTGPDVLKGRVLMVDGVATMEQPVAVKEAPPERIVTESAKARGTVTLHNTHAVDQPLVATTRLLASDATLFRLDRSVVVPAKGTLADVPVTADAVGGEGNIPPTRFSIPGLSSWMQQRVWAESTAPMHGGATAGAGGSVPVVTEQELAAARDTARQKAEEDVRARARSLAATSEESVVLDLALQESIDGNIGEVRNAVAVKTVASARVLFVPRGLLRDHVQRALSEAAAAQGRTLRAIREDALTLRVVSERADQKQVTIAIHAEGDARIAPAFEAFDVRRIVGFGPEEIQSYIKSIPGVEQVDVQLWPFWVKNVPMNGKVEVEVRE